jgi:predicted MFS family arabinose efflux permease
MNLRNLSRDLPLKFWIVTLVAFINSVSFTIIIPLLYPYAKQFGLSDFEASLLTTAYAISQFFGTPILGRLSDRFGRKPLLILSLVGTVVANLIASITSTAWLLYTARILDGLTGGNTSIARAVISDTTTPQQRPKAFGIFDAMFRLGFVAGPTLSYVAQQLPTVFGISSLGMSFLVAAAVAIIATVLTVFFLPETMPQSEKQQFRLNWRDFGFVKIAQSATRPRVGRIFILTFFSGATFTIFTFAFQPFVLNVLNQDAQTLAIIFAVIGMIGFTTQVFTIEPLRKRFNMLDIIFVALMARGIVFLLMPTVSQMMVFFIIIAIFGIVNSFPLPLLNSILSINSKQQEQGEVLGINAAYLSLSNALGPAISGLLVSLGYRTPFLITGVLTILTAMFALQLKSKLNCEQKSI